MDAELCLHHQTENTTYCFAFVPPVMICGEALRLSHFPTGFCETMAGVNQRRERVQGGKLIQMKVVHIVSLNSSSCCTLRATSRGWICEERCASVPTAVECNSA